MCSITGQRQAQSVSPGCTGVVCKPDSATCLASCPQELLLIRDQVCVSIVCGMVVKSFVCGSPSRAVWPLEPAYRHHPMGHLQIEE